MESCCRKNLLEDLAASVGCAYLSELHQTHLLPAVLSCAASLSPEDYLPAMWNDAIEYLLNRTKAFASSREAQKFLCSELSQKVKE